jgi:hypothetical protein
MKNVSLVAIAFAVAGLAGCDTMKGMMPGSGWTTLVDGGKGLENFDRVGNSNWRVEDGAIVADRNPDKTPSYLVTRTAYTNYVVRAEFWASNDANSGIFNRCKDAKNPGDETCYEANIFDQRPDPTYATGAIVKVAPVTKDFERAGGKWNTMEITMEGAHLTVVFNGKKTVDVQNDKLSSGPLGLQHGTGTIKFRKVEIKSL